MSEGKSTVEVTKLTSFVRTNDNIANKFDELNDDLYSVLSRTAEEYHRLGIDTIIIPDKKEGVASNDKPSEPTNTMEEFDASLRHMERGIIRLRELIAMAKELEYRINKF